MEELKNSPFLSRLVEGLNLMQELSDFEKKFANQDITKFKSKNKSAQDLPKAGILNYFLVQNEKKNLYKMEYD